MTEEYHFEIEGVSLPLPEFITDEWRPLYQALLKAMSQMVKSIPGFNVTHMLACERLSSAYIRSRLVENDTELSVGQRKITDDMLRGLLRELWVEVRSISREETWRENLLRDISGIISEEVDRGNVAKIIERFEGLAK